MRTLQFRNSCRLPSARRGENLSGPRSSFAPASGSTYPRLLGQRPLVPAGFERVFVTNQLISTGLSSNFSNRCVARWSACSFAGARSPLSTCHVFLLAAVACTAKGRRKRDVPWGPDVGSCFAIEEAAQKTKIYGCREPWLSKKTYPFSFAGFHVHML